MSGSTEAVPASDAAFTQDGVSRDWSPTWIGGGRVAFFRHDRNSAVGKVMLVDVSRRETELLRDDPAKERLGNQLTGSPDGRSLAWIGNSRLFSVRPDRPRMRFLGYGARFSWAPTSRLLVVADELGSGLRVIRADGSGLVRTLTRGPYDRRPAWSPMGRLIAFEHADVAKDPSTGIYIVGATGGRPRLLTRRGGGATWAPNGQSIAFVDGTDVWSMAVNATGQRRILRGVTGPNENGPNLSWSPTGARLLVALSSGRFPPTGRFLIATRSGRIIARLRGENPVWSRDGRRIAYESIARCRNPGIWTTTAVGRSPTRLTGAC